MSSPAFAVFLDLVSGVTLEVNVMDNITALSPVSATALKAAGQATGTTIQFDGRSINVRGTVAATLATIAAVIPPGNVGPSNAIYVDIAGSNTTGVRGDASKPFLTLAGALGATGLASGDEIIVGPGTFTGPVTLPAVANLTIRGEGSEVTFLTAAANVDVVKLNNANRLINLIDLNIAAAVGTGRGIEGTGAASATAFLNLGLFIQDCRVSGGGAAVTSLELSYAGIVQWNGVTSVGALSFTTCSSVRLNNVRHTGDMLTTWSNTDALKPAAGQGTTFLTNGSSVSGTLSMTGQAKLDVDATSTVGALTGLNLSVAAGPVNPSLVFRGSVGTVDFGSAAAKIIPDSALGAITWDMSGCTITGATAEFESITTDQIVNLTGFSSTASAFALTAGVRALVIALGASIRTTTIATMYATPDASGSITPPYLKGLANIAAGGALALTWSQIGYTGLVRVGTAVFDAQVQANIQASDVVVPIAGKVVTGLTITSTAQAGNTACSVQVQF